MRPLHFAFCGLIVGGSLAAETMKCISTKTLCPGKGWVTSSCNDPNPCGFSNSGSSASGDEMSEASRALGTALGKAIACKMFSLGCPDQPEDANAREAFHRLPAEQRAKFLKAVAEEEAKAGIAQNKLSDLAQGKAVDGLQLRGLEETPTPKPLTDKEKVINAMNAWAKQQGWPDDERKHLVASLNKIGSDGDMKATRENVVATWKNIVGRSSSELAKEAAKGSGPGFPSAGTQGDYNDCAIFALANAGGVPYSVVAARAGELMKDAKWRLEIGQDTNFKSAIKKSGLTGGEVILLAEAMGRAEVVKSKDFPKYLKKGEPILINVTPQDGDFDGGHEVVLSKTFQHNGQTWYEMVDSHQGPTERRYLSEKELNTILQENGVAYRPDKGTTPQLLRSNAEETH